MEKLQKVLAMRKDMFVVARTDADNLNEAFRRAEGLLRQVLMLFC